MVDFLSVVYFSENIYCYLQSEVFVDSDQSVTRGVKFPVEHHQSFFIFTIGQLKAGQRMLSKFRLILLKKGKFHFCDNRHYVK